MSTSGPLLAAPMKVGCHLSEHCGSYHQLPEHIDRALANADLRAAVDYHPVQDGEAVARRIKGSLSVRSNGKDLYNLKGLAGIT